MEGIVKFIYIALCFIISLVALKNHITKTDSLLLATGMFFTLASDFAILILLNNPLGVFLFCFVHIMYIIRNGFWHKLKIYLISAAICFGLAYFTEGLLAALSAAYACLFAADLYTAQHAYRERRLPVMNRRLVLLGLILFALCDINVLLFNLRFYIKNSIITETVSSAALILSWVFYAPSQLALALSGINLRKYRR